MARYRKICPGFWASVEGLGPLEKLVAIYCLTAPGSNGFGLYVLSPGRAAEDLGIDAETLQQTLGQTLPPTFTQTFRERLEKVCEHLGWCYNAERRTLYIPTWWRWNHPPNQNVLKNALKGLAEAAQLPYFQEFAANLTHLEPAFHQTFLECVRNVTPNVTPNVTLNHPETGAGAGTGTRRGARTREGSGPSVRSGSIPEYKNRSGRTTEVQAGPDLQTEAGPDRAGRAAGDRFHQVTLWRLGEALGLDADGLKRQNKSLSAVIRWVRKQPEPEALAARLIALAAEKRDDNLEHPVRAWQAAVNDMGFKRGSRE